VTFNYDKMIESALPSVGVSINELSDYIRDPAFKLFKLHGSVDWAREIEMEIDLPADQWSIARELIRRVEELKSVTGIGW